MHIVPSNVPSHFETFPASPYVMLSREQLLITSIHSYLELQNLMRISFNYNYIALDAYSTFLTRATDNKSKVALHKHLLLFSFQ